MIYPDDRVYPLKPLFVSLPDKMTKEAGFEYYRYDPSLAAAAIFVALFLLVTGLHLYQLLRTRTWYFIPFVIGGCCTFSVNFCEVHY